MRYLIFCLASSSKFVGVHLFFVFGQILFDATDKVIGIGTNDMGISKDGSKKENFQRGVEIKGFFSVHVSFFCAHI